MTVGEGIAIGIVFAGMLGILLVVVIVAVKMNKIERDFKDVSISQKTLTKEVLKLTNEVNEISLKQQQMSKSSSLKPIIREKNFHRDDPLDKFTK